MMHTLTQEKRSILMCAAGARDIVNTGTYVSSEHQGFLRVARDAGVRGRILRKQNTHKSGIFFFVFLSVLYYGCIRLLPDTSLSQSGAWKNATITRTGCRWAID